MIRCRRPGGGHSAGGMLAWLVCIFIGLLDPASAQENFLEGRLAIHANYGYQISSEELRLRIDFDAYGEDGEILSTHNMAGGPLFDVGGLIVVWEELSVGASYAKTNGTAATIITGSVPHPILLASDRTIPSHTPDLTREERATHIHLAWRIDLPVEKLDLRIMGGPSYFSLTQGIVTGLDISEAGPPFTTVNVNRMSSGDFVKSAWGAHAAVDVTYMVSPKVGVGGFVRFAQGAATLAVGDADVLVSVGGLQTGGGIRIRF